MSIHACEMLSKMCPKEGVMSQNHDSTNHTQEHTNGNKHGTKMLVYYLPTQNITTIPIFGQNQNMSWDKLGQIGTSSQDNSKTDSRERERAPHSLEQNE